MWFNVSLHIEDTFNCLSRLVILKLYNLLLQHTAKRVQEVFASPPPDMVQQHTWIWNLSHTPTASTRYEELSSPSLSSARSWNCSVDSLITDRSCRPFFNKLMQPHLQHSAACVHLFQLLSCCTKLSVTVNIFFYCTGFLFSYSSDVSSRSHIKYKLGNAWCVWLVCLNCQSLPSHIWTMCQTLICVFEQKWIREKWLKCCFW